MSHFLSFPQKSLENKINDRHQKIKEELKKYNMDILEDEIEKMLFLREVKIAGQLVSETPALLCPTPAILAGPGLPAQAEKGLVETVVRESCSSWDSPGSRVQLGRRVPWVHSLFPPPPQGGRPKAPDPAFDYLC